MPPSLFGRAAQSQRLDEALTAALAGSASVALIEGEPGIGKTALLDAATTRARELGFRVFAGRAEEVDQDRPFRPIAEAMGCDRGIDERRGEILRLLGSVSIGEAVFYRLIDAFEDLVEAEALTGPTLLTIDDLQWADRGTVRALGSIWRRTDFGFPLAIAVTLRRAPRSDELHAILRRLPSRSTWISLPALDAAAVDKMVWKRVGAAPGPRLRAHVDGAGGNPFYVAELIDALRAESAIHFHDAKAEIERAALPPSLVLTLLHRLSGLPDGVLEILRSAAVLGTSFRIDELATAAEVGEGEALDAVKLLRSESVLSDDGEKVRFRHDLIREAVYDDLGGAVQMSMHRRIGHALAQAGASAIDVVRHLLRGALPGDADAAGWMTDAAADPGVDARTAAVLIERALAINPGHPQRIALVRRLAGLLIWQGRAAEAIPHLQSLLSETSEIAERLAVIEKLVNACSASGRSHDAASWVEQGAALAEQLGNGVPPTILAMRARALFYNLETEAALQLTEQVAADVHGSGGVMEAEANNQASWLLTLLCRSEEALAYSTRAVSLPPSSPAVKSIYWRHHAFALADLDRIEEAEAALAVARAVSEEEGLGGVVHNVIMDSAHLRYSIGRWDDAVVDAETADKIAQDLDGAREADAVAIPSWIAYHRLEDEALERIRSQRTDGGEADTWSAALHAVAAFDDGDIDEASRSVRTLLNQISGPRVKQRREFDLIPTLTRVALATGDEDSALVGLQTAAKLAKRSGAPGVALTDARCRAIVDRDVSAARTAVDLARSSPRLLLAAEAFEDAASVLDPDEAADALEEASRLYAGMGATRGLGRVAARLQELGKRDVITFPGPRAVSGWDALTPAELQVVRLAIDGLTNRQIGARLFVSHRTVATHLTHVFQKLGLRSRVELAREAAAHPHVRSRT